MSRHADAYWRQMMGGANKIPIQIRQQMNRFRRPTAKQEDRMPFELRFKITFKRGPKEIAVVEGFRPLAGDATTVAELQENVLATEAFLEKLTGYRVHIEQAH